MPLLLLLLGVTSLVVVSARHAHAAPPPGPRGRTQTFTLDANMPDVLRNQVLAALVSGTDAATLDAFATAIQVQYPLSAALLHAKAASLRAHPAPQLPPLPQPAPAPVPQGPPSPPAVVDPGGPALDANMPPAVAAYVHEELLVETDPMKLLALANQLARQGYPVASAIVQSQAAVLNVQPPAPIPSPQPSPVPAPPTPASPPAPAPGTVGLDPAMPPSLAQTVMGALVSENDPAKLQALAQQLSPQYPIASNLLAMKANALLAAQQQQPQPAPQPMPPAPQPAPSPVVAPGSSTLLDAGMPPDVAQQVLGELASEGDPTKLQALADQLALHYPIAAGLLRARADVILATRPPPQIIPSYPPPPDVLTASYTVQKGDFPWRIAEKITGHGARWPELVAANSSKKRDKEGNFASLLPGEKLALPASWGLNPGAANVPSAPVPMPSPAPSAPSTPPAPTGPALDANIPPGVATAVLNALSAASDPNQLRGFATAIAQSGFPIAAALLNARADALAPPAPVLNVNYPGSTASPTTVAPVAAPPTYKVKAGDNPSKIAGALVHDASRWKELVAANPSKKRAKDGNFASLQAGELLQLPLSWIAPTNGAAAKPALTTLSHGGA